MGLIKTFLVMCIAAVGLLGFGALAAVGYLASGGFATVQVETPDTNLYIPFPMRIVDLGMGVARLAIPDLSELDEARAQMEPYRPLLHEIEKEVGSLPDGEFVRVQGDDELIVVGQRRGRLTVEVDAPDAHVRVTVPRRSAHRAVRQAFELLDG